MMTTIINVKDYGAVGDGITDDTQAIQNAINAAFNNKSYIKGVSGETYLISSINLPAGFYDFRGVTFLSNGSLNGNSYVINCQEGVNINELKIVVPTTNTLERVLSINSNSIIDFINIISETQHSNSNDLLDSCVIVSGNNIHIKQISIKNFDNSVCFYDVTDSHIQQINCENYKRGVYIRKSANLYIDNLQTKGKSVTSSYTAGHNGLLIEDSELIFIKNTFIQDAGEHGIRIGGVRDKTYSQSNMYFDSIITKKCGGCGFKVYSGAINDSPTTIRYININSLVTVDCSYNQSPARNKDGLYIANGADIKINNFRCYTETTNVSSCSGIYLSGVDRLYIGNVEIRGSANTGITIDLNYGRVNEVFMDNVNIKSVKNEGILINHSGEVLRDLIFKNVFIREFGTNYYGVKVVASLIYQPVLFSGFVAKNNSLGAFTSNGSFNNLYNNLTLLS